MEYFFVFCRRQTRIYKDFILCYRPPQCKHEHQTTINSATPHQTPKKFLVCLAVGNIVGFVCRGSGWWSIESGGTMYCFIMTVYS